MEISTTNPNPSPAALQSASSAADAAAASVDYNAFLQLLIAQMKNQDPTRPMDSQQFIAQLASFSNVEQGIKMNQKLESLMTSMALSQVDGVIGRTVTSSDGSVSGTVAAVRVVDGGAVAILGDGREVLLGSGVTIE
jgi:flagellar basal-body rod modification protein FlgD